jgi:predicted MFS family arabinose efflux permease
MRRFDVIVLTFITVVLVAALTVISWRTLVTAEGILLPALDRKAEVVGRSISQLVAQADKYGMRLDDLVGVDAVFETALGESAEFGTLALLDPGGRVLVLSTRNTAAGQPLRGLDGLPVGMRYVALPIVSNGHELGRVAIGIPDTVIEAFVLDLWLDVAVVLLVSVLVTLELIAFAFAMGAGSSLRAIGQRLDSLRRGDLSRHHQPPPGGGRLGEIVAGIDRRITALRMRQKELREAAFERRDVDAMVELDAVDRKFRLTRERVEPPLRVFAVRAPLFLFFFAEEMTRPFLPTFIGEVAGTIPGLSREMVISLPIVLFMLIVAGLQPWLNGLTERIGRGRALRLGATAAVAGFVGTAVAADLWQILAFRSLTAVGYAAVFVSAQGYIIDNTGGLNRARGLALLVTSIMVAALCGPLIGGIFADRIGIRLTFVVSAALSLTAVMTARLALADDGPTRSERLVNVSFRDVMRVVLRPTMGLLLIGCAFPAKLILAALVFFMVPLVLSDEGFDQAAIGRVLMLYALAMLVFVPFVSRISQVQNRRPALVVVGGLVAATAVVHPFLWPEPWGAAAAVLQLGIAQALSITPQSALVGDIGRRVAPEISEGTLYGVFRVIERAGNAVGPLLAAWLLGGFGQAPTLVVLGVVVAVGALLFLLSVVADSRAASPIVIQRNRPAAGA